MGLESQCLARHQDCESTGVLYLETSALTFKGAFSIHLPLAEIRHLEVRAGDLLITTSTTKAAFTLGKQAEKWLLKIRYPKGRLDKLGVKPNLRVAVLGNLEPDFLAELESRVGKITHSRIPPACDIVFLSIENTTDLARIENVRPKLAGQAALWTVYPKGRKDITQTQVMSAGKAAGLVDVKVVGFSDRCSSLKWVIPVSAR